jgi:hypothetical protein
LGFLPQKLRFLLESKPDAHQPLLPVSRIYGIGNHGSGGTAVMITGITTVGGIPICEK